MINEQELRRIIAAVTEKDTPKKNISNDEIMSEVLNISLILPIIKRLLIGMTAAICFVLGVVSFLAGLCFVRLGA
jgi:hypothetical protein